jgi:rare lipoprotein A
MFKLTAAHPELPLGSFVRVTNLNNLRSVVVRVNDRGPITPGRVIDLSYQAAELLQFNHKGIEKVRIDLVEQQAPVLTARNLSNYPGRTDE